MEQALLLFYVRPARRKATNVAQAEAVALLNDLEPQLANGGPLAEQGGIFWLYLPSDKVLPATARLPRLGYTQAVDLAEPVPEKAAGGEVVRWKRQSYQFTRLYEEDEAATRQQAPDRRTFLLETPAGGLRPVQGYRGDGGPLGKRGLPVYDARLLVNLVWNGTGGRLLDPFGGIGGVLLEAKAGGWQVFSTDRDPAVRYGLAAMSDWHCLADSSRLPFADNSFEAIATEPPYDREAAASVEAALVEMQRVLKPGGRLAMLCADWQAPTLRQIAIGLNLIPYLDSPINRKGLDVTILAWKR